MIIERIHRALALGLLGVALLAAATPAAAATWPTGAVHVAVPTVRVGNNSSYSTAVYAAKRAYPGWTGVHDVVIVSAAQSARFDAAAASSLCWAYDAPLLLTDAKSLPAVTRTALSQIVSANSSVTVHVVASSASVSPACLNLIRSAAGTAVVEQPWKAATTYSLASAIAGRVREVAAANGSSVPSVALLASASEPDRLWDAALAAAISRHTGIPLFFTAEASVPHPTLSALASAGHPRVIVVGGTGAVSPALYRALGAQERWGGAGTAATAIDIAAHASSRNWSSVATFAVAASAGDAAIGSALVGRSGGIVLASGGARLDRATWTFLAARQSKLATAYGMGGRPLADSQIAELSGAPAVPWLTAGSPGHYVGKKARISGQVAGNATKVSVYVRGIRIRTVSVRPWASFSFASVPMPVNSGRVEVVVGNPTGRIARAGRAVVRLKYPSATCIVIDKSDFKLYWIRDNALVKAYPIATGRLGMETPAPATWKILAKYKPDPHGVYGPRKMRLFRQRGGHYVFSRYGIHGTNQPWVIGTKASHGCIRMYNRDILELWPQVPLGTMVYTRR